MTSDPIPTPPPLLMSNGRPLIIAVIGGGDPPDWAMELAEQVGGELAKRGAIVVCGGLRGVMEAVCRGAKAEAGTTIGILPGNSPADANRYVDIPVCSGLGYARIVIVVKTGRAVIAIDGSFCTLSEIGHALGDGIPVIGLETWELSMDSEVESSIVRTTSAEEAVEQALEAAARRARRERIRMH